MMWIFAPCVQGSIWWVTYLHAKPFYKLEIIVHANKRFQAIFCDLFTPHFKHISQYTLSKSLYVCNNDTMRCKYLQNSNFRPRFWNMHCYAAAILALQTPLLRRYFKYNVIGWAAGPACQIWTSFNEQGFPGSEWFFFCDYGWPWAWQIHIQFGLSNI